MTLRVFKYLPLSVFVAAFISASVYIPRLEASEADGQLVILNKKNADGSYPINCSIPFVSSIIDFQNNSLGCGNDDAYAFRLENVPSATFFSFHDTPNCSESGGFSYRFKTIKQPTNMVEALEIEEAGKKPVGAVVVPGVMMISSSTSGQVGGKLSCVKIERSAVPSP
ncbi:hypothetical protein [Pseudomonas sp. NPDC089734]|uniref:hypothetical protein n=1 Tax=Pseudomonas sp. NPDC089734 TaxID=3364469 RepID=UPI003816057D